MSETTRATEFAVFCIENVATRLKKSGTEVFRELKRTNGITGFLYPSYPALHTQSKEFIVEETLQYIAQHDPLFVQEKGTAQ